MAGPETAKTAPDPLAGFFWPMSYTMQLANLAAAQLRMAYEFQHLAYETGRGLMARHGLALEEAVAEPPEPSPLLLSAAADMREAGAAMMEAQLDTLRVMGMSR